MEAGIDNLFSINTQHDALLSLFRGTAGEVAHVTLRHKRHIAK